MRAGDPRMLGQLQGRLYYYDDEEEKEVKSRNSEAARTLDEKLDALEADKDIPDDLYLAEMRFCTKSVQISRVFYDSALDVAVQSFFFVTLQSLP